MLMRLRELNAKLGASAVSGSASPLRLMLGLYVLQDEEKAMMEFRAQLDADRAARLAKGTNNAHLKDSTKRKRSDKDKKKGKDKKSKKEKKEKRSKDKKPRKDSKKKRRRSSSGSSSDNGSESDVSEPKPKRKSSPVRLSEFLKGN